MSIHFPILFIDICQKRQFKILFLNGISANIYCLHLLLPELVTYTQTKRPLLIIRRPK